MNKPGQDGYHDTSTEGDTGQPALMWNLSKGRVFDKSHNYQARSARRLVIEATFTV